MQKDRFFLRNNRLISLSIYKILVQDETKEPNQNSSKSESLDYANTQIAKRVDSEEFTSNTNPIDKINYGSRGNVHPKYCVIPFYTHFMWEMEEKMEWCEFIYCSCYELWNVVFYFRPLFS